MESSAFRQSFREEKEGGEGNARVSRSPTDDFRFSSRSQTRSTFDTNARERRCSIVEIFGRPVFLFADKCIWLRVQSRDRYFKKIHSSGLKEISQTVFGVQEFVARLRV